MTRRLARFALVLALMVGVVAMHSFGHGAGHGASESAQPVASAGHHLGAAEPAAMVGHHTHIAVDSQPEPDAPEEEGDPASALHLVGMMLCGAVLARLALDVLRAAWSRLWTRLLALASPPARLGRATRRWLPPPLLEPTALRLNRIAVLRI